MELLISLPYILLPLSSQRFIASKMRVSQRLFVSLVRNIFEHITGLSVSATNVDMITETAMVMVNCRYSEPVIPDRKLTGTNTAHNTSEVADNTLELDTISFPAFGAGIPENKGKRTVVRNGRIYMEEIGQIFPHFVWINSHLATRDIKVNDVLLTSGRLLPEHTRLVLVIERRGIFDDGY